MGLRKTSSHYHSIKFQIQILEKDTEIQWTVPLKSFQEILKLCYENYFRSEEHYCLFIILTSHLYLIHLKL